MKEEIQMTEKHPRKESAMIAPSRGNKLVLPLTMLKTWAASILLTLNSPIMYTMRLLTHPAFPSVKQADVAACSAVLSIFIN